MQSVLQPRDDPTGHARRVHPDWTVTSKLPVFTQLSDRQIVPCHHGRIRPGDFVDVLVTVDITEPLGRADPIVRFNLCQVIQLKPRAVRVVEVRFFTGQV